MFYNYSEDKPFVSEHIHEEITSRPSPFGFGILTRSLNYRLPYRFDDEHSGTYSTTELPDFFNDPFWRKILINLGVAVYNPDEFEKVVKRLDYVAGRSEHVADNLRRLTNEIKMKNHWLDRRIEQVNNWVDYLKLGPVEHEARMLKELHDLVDPSVNKVNNDRNSRSGSENTGAVTGNTWSGWLGKNYVNVGVAGVATLAALAGIYALYRYLRNRKKKTIKQEEIKYIWR